MHKGKIVNRLALRVSTLGPVGYLKASGTMATLVTLPFVIFLQKTFSLPFYSMFLCLSIVVAFCCIQKSLWLFNSEDPSQIVIDEYIGCLITFYALPLYNNGMFFIGFILFRFFDIVKCFGVKRCESFGGPLGILLDDMVAGLWANVCLQGFYFATMHYV